VLWGVHTDPLHVVSMATNITKLLLHFLFVLQPVSHNTPTVKASLCDSGPLIAIIAIIVPTTEVTLLTEQSLNELEASINPKNSSPP